MTQPLDQAINDLWRKGQMQQPPTTGPQSDKTAPGTLPPGSRYELTIYEADGPWYGVLHVPGHPTESASCMDEISCLAKLKAMHMGVNQ